MSKKHHPSQETENGMVRGLQNRHVQLIAIAGTIGQDSSWSRSFPFFDRSLYYFSLYRAFLRSPASSST